MRGGGESLSLQSEEIVNLRHHIGMVWEELAFNDTLSYTEQRNELQHSYMLRQRQD